MLGKDLKLNDTLYYADIEKRRIVEYKIKEMKREELGRDVGHSGYGEPEYIIRFGFGDSWEKKPAITPDSDNCISKYSNFPLFIKEEDAKSKLVEYLSEEMDQLEEKKKMLESKIKDLLD